MFEETAIALAEGIANFGGQRPTRLLTQLLAKRSGREDKFLQAVGDAFAQIGESSGIPVLLGELERLKRTFGAYPECLVKKNDPFVFTVQKQ
jgi:hypothetical protein